MWACVGKIYNALGLTIIVVMTIPNINNCYCLPAIDSIQHFFAVFVILFSLSVLAIPKLLSMTNNKNKNPIKLNIKSSLAENTNSLLPNSCNSHSKFLKIHYGGKILKLTMHTELPVCC